MTIGYQDLRKTLADFAKQRNKLEAMCDASMSSEETRVRGALEELEFIEQSLAYRCNAYRGLVFLGIAFTVLAIVLSE